MDTWHLPPPRLLVAIGVTLVAVVLLGLRACAGDDGGESGDASTTTTGATTSVVVTGDTADTTTSSIVILPDWYPKQTSRYSDREPVVTVTTLPPTSATTTTEAGFDTRGVGDAGENACRPRRSRRRAGDGTRVETVNFTGLPVNADHQAIGGTVKQGVELHGGAGLDTTSPRAPVAGEDLRGMVRTVPLARATGTATEEVERKAANAFGNGAARRQRGRAAQRRLAGHRYAGSGRNGAEQRKKLRRGVRQSALRLDAE